MMSNFKDEWDKLFIIWVKALSYIDGEPVHVTDSSEIFVGNQNITSGTKTIIDEILLYLQKMIQIHSKYRRVTDLFLQYSKISSMIVLVPLVIFWLPTKISNESVTCTGSPSM